ncbi:30S ribosomal protein S6, partial [bacterium]|nr:30S ribosomal protein S6 [bacterium]
MKTYETIFFLSPSLSEESNEALSGKVEGAITRFGGQIEKVNRWGKRRLSY